MTITTSYFASKAPVERKVIISLKRPRYIKAGTTWVKVLAPSNPFVADWKEAYRTDLENRFPDGKGLKELLDDLCKTVPDPILCCYEKNPEECHRSILADYIQEHLGLKIQEWAA